MDFIGSRKKVNLTVEEICAGEDLVDLAISFSIDYKLSEDPVFEAATVHLDGGRASSLEFAKMLLSMLYRIGAIGIKISENDRYQWSH